ncbi:polyamine-modulated factor 1 [Eucyclogobius newberryi]|uniref:polyamine-modulated factor 1 n=1 Tax=Eucyclogobius newberryi TaxID=166745 RepID=UPI003B59BCB4
MEQQDGDFGKETEEEAVTEPKTLKAPKTSCKKTKSSSSATNDYETEARFSRLKLFEKVMQKSLDNFIEIASFNRFTSTFRPLHKKNPQRMESIYKQFIEELKGAIRVDITRLIEEGRLETKLYELDKLESDAKNKMDPAWRPSGVPEQDLCSFLMPYYQKQETYMRRELKKIQADNAVLTEKVLAGRERLSHTEHHISAAVEDWKISVTEFEKLASALSPDVTDL